ncbi:MAG: PD-(D/E)XK nuclease family transposase, partial [Oscillospiraceae bacterium]|nr:PD-(D/E)XK nuclease family transposase [Oscillospiraceae bacterium]
MNGTEYNERQIIDQISTINLLEDKAFKIALSNESLFRLITKEITGSELHDGKFNYNGEILVTVKNKKIVLDSLVKTDKEWVDIEGQQKAGEFPFARHLYYWATIYSQSLTEGMKYSDLIPVTVIVIYKDKGSCGMKEESMLGGKLAERKATRNHLRLIAVNAAKWKESESESLRAYLYLLHRGFGGIDSPESCAEIDFSTNEGRRIWHAMRGSCAESLLEKVEN